MTGRRALIVGGRGFVGAHVTREFLARGWDVTVYGPRMELDLLADCAGRFLDIEGSIEDEGASRRAIGQARADVVLSLAAYSSGPIGLARSGESDIERAIAINALGLKHLLDACVAAGIRRLVWASSTVVFGPKACYGAGPVDEEAPRRPHSAYGLSKVLAEDIALYHRDRHGIETCGIRLPLVFGPGCWYAGVAGALVHLIEDVAAGRPGRLEASPGPVDLLYALDAGRVFAHLSDYRGALPPVYHVKGFAASFADVAKALRRLRPDATVECVSTEPGIDYPLVDAGRIARETGFAPLFDLEGAVEAYLRALKGAAG